MWHCRTVKWGPVQYANADGTHVAFMEVTAPAAGDLEIVMLSGAFWPMESFADDPIASRLVEGLATLGRVVLFDRRGVGLSDPVVDRTTSILEQWADDIAAVVDAAGYDRPAVFSWHNAPVGPTFAIRHPERLNRLVLFNPSAPVNDDDRGWIEEFLESQERLMAGEEQDDRHQAFPHRSKDPAFMAWNEAAGRAGASPSQARRLQQLTLLAPFPELARVRTPTLVVTRRPPDYYIPAEFTRRAASLIPDAELVELPPGDGGAVGLGVDDLLAAISEYLTGEVRLPAPERQIAVILFTDLVGSTRRAAAAGDASWRRLLDRHDAVSEREVVRRGGELIKSTGDGILALLPSATAAIEAGRAIRTGLEADGLQIRTGIHIGEIDRRSDDVSGLAVNTAARIMSVADAGEILTSDVVRQVSDTGTFRPAGSVELKDLDGSFELYFAD
jgi:class 3 adenylate cyclase/pimeloyl-ACP methyl ester carboxylesterase